jgi:hypothetical protein
VTIDISVEIRNVGDSSLIRYYSVKHVYIDLNTREIERSNKYTIYSYIILIALVD